MSCKRLQPSHHPCANLLTLVPARSTEYIATGDSQAAVDLQPDTHGCPGKHGRQLWIQCGGGDNTRGGQPHRTFIFRGRKPIPRCCDRHPFLGWCTELNARPPVGRTSEITREPDGTSIYTHTQQAHESSTNTSSACWRPRHRRQRSCPSYANRKRPQPEGHGRKGILKRTRL